MLVFGFAELDSTESVVELGADWTGLFAEVVALAGSGVINTLDGTDDGSGAACTCFLKVYKLVNGDGTTLDLDAHILGQLHEALVGDGGKNRGALRCDIDTILNTEEVGCTSLVDVFLLLSVQIELAGILTTVASCGMSLQAGSIVTTDLIDTGTQRGWPGNRP